MNILVVEDDERVARFLVRGLKEEGFNVSHCPDGKSALETGLSQTFNMILLDWSLPDLDGLTVLKRWRDAGVVGPVIMITARTGIDNTVLSLDHGADDFIEKPFSFEELLARIRANIRRCQLSGGANKPSRLLRLGAAEVDLEAREVVCQGERTSLSNREYHLLNFLLKNRGKVLSRSGY